MAHDDLGKIRYNPITHEHEETSTNPTMQDGPGIGFIDRVRRFESGATRDTVDDKLDYDGFLSHLVLERYAEYMHIHRVQKDGTIRASDNWTKGIPRAEYMKSMWRHFMEVWKLQKSNGPTSLLEVSLCALLFNIMGMLDSILRGNNNGPRLD